MAINNQIKTVLLLGLLTALLLWIGSFWGMQGLTIALIFVLIMNGVSYFFSDKIVLMIYRGKEVTDKNHRLYKIVNEVRQMAGLPMPKVYVLPGAYSNAMATGRSPEHSAVCASEGILALLNDHELKGVIAHEISHIKNRDILISTIAAVIAGVIGYVAMMARFAAIFGSRDRDGGSAIELLVLAILTPLIAALIQLAISRSREYLADEGAAKLLHNGEGLAKALEKLDKDIAKKPLAVTGATETSAHLFIANPFRKVGFVQLFMTHPKSEERIKRLRSMRF